MVGVVDTIESRRNRLANECGTQALSDCRTILDALDAAVIATPTRSHHELAMCALKRGIHLLVEKPLAATTSEADELVRTAKQNRVLLQVGHVERFNPAFVSVLPHVERPKYIEAVRAGNFTFRSMDIGVVLDLMIHDIDLVLSTVRSPLRRIQAVGISVLGAHEDVANARLEFRCGCVATLSASRVSYQPVRRMQIWSLGGFASVDFAARVTTVVSPSEALFRRKLDIAGLADEPADHRDRILAEHLPRTETRHEAVDALGLELDDFIESIRASREPQVTGEQARDAVAVAEQILADIDAHTWENELREPAGPAYHPRVQGIPSPHWNMSSTTGLVAELP